jgi:hypothetical protein
MLFIDHNICLVYPSFQESKTASEACRSKCDYEKFAQRYQVTVKSYNADNISFRSETFQKAIDNKNQHLNFSGVNAQWQNGLVERSNGTLCAAACSILNHVISKWDNTITAEQWPFAIKHTATIYNTTKRRSRDYDIRPWEKSLVNAPNLTKMTCTPYSVQFTFMTDVRKRSHHPLIKGLRWTPSPLFIISTNGMVPENKTGLAIISCHV